jgi:hypothetical protein
MKANGRINLLDAPNAMSLYDRNASTKPKSFFDALTGNWEDTPLSRAFFSAENQQILQNGIRAGVYNMSGGRYSIAQQSYDEIKIIMRAIYLQETTNTPGNLTSQISALNQSVLNYIVPKVYNEAKGYLVYIRDASTLVVPLSAPVNSVVYDKTLELKPFF